MNAAAIPFALCAGASVALFVWSVGRPWKRLAPRVAPYTVAVRTRLGAPPAEMLALVDAPRPGAGAFAAVFGPIAASLAARLSRIFGHRDDEALALALDRAGIRGVSPRTYAFQQLAYAVGGLVGGFLLGLSRGGRAGVAYAVVGLFVGSTWKRNELTRRVDKRTAKMRAELVQVCPMLAVFATAIPNVQTAAAELVRRAGGEVVGEFARVLDMIESGVAPERAFRRMAELTPEPAAGRLYQRLAVALESGGEIVTALKVQSDELRDAFRDERKVRATRRLQMMVITNSTFMLLPTILLCAAAIPSMVLGTL